MRLVTEREAVGVGRIARILAAVVRVRPLGRIGLADGRIQFVVCVVFSHTATFRRTADPVNRGHDAADPYYAAAMRRGAGAGSRDHARGGPRRAPGGRR
jgi:hypothetical protein